MSKINKVNFDGAYLRSSSGHFCFHSCLYISSLSDSFQTLLIKSCGTVGSLSIVWIFEYLGVFLLAFYVAHDYASKPKC